VELKPIDEEGAGLNPSSEVFFAVVVAVIPAKQISPLLRRAFQRRDEQERDSLCAE
jgi:hypothetical protein